jgi:hypothetical protein
MKKIIIFDIALFPHIKKQYKIPSDVKCFCKTPFFGVLINKETLLFEQFITTEDDINEIVENCKVNNIKLVIEYPLRITELFKAFKVYIEGEKDRSIANTSYVILEPKMN